MEGEIRHRIDESSNASIGKKKSLDDVEGSKQVKLHTKKAYPKVVHSKTDGYTIVISSAILFSLAVGYSHKPEWYEKFIKLQYRYPFATSSYDIGTDDVYIVATFVVFLCLLRSLLLEYVLKPLACYKFNIRSAKTQVRFAEQGWSMIYYSMSWMCGMYLYYNSPYFLNCKHIYLNWPHDELSGLLKVYYLVQIASWLQQIIVLCVEERRKDYWQMFAHHIITVALTTGSYYYYFTRTGHVILIMMDVVDILLSAAKMLRYCSYTVACDVMFFIFLLLWFALRHVVYNYVLYYTWAKSRDDMGPGRCLENSYAKRCWSPFIIDTFVALLAGLQVLTIVWFWMIIKVLIKVVKGTGAEDLRSDDEQ